MTIPFIRKLPNGRRSLQEITRPDEIELLGQRFIAHDGRYLIEIQTDLKVHLTAIIDIDGEVQAVATETCDNGPELLEAVDRLVRVSEEKIPAARRVGFTAPEKGAA